MFARLTAIILHHRRTSLVTLTLLVAAVCGGIGLLRADFSVRSFFGADDPETTYLADYQARWGETDMLMIVADGGEAGLLARDRLQALDDLVDRLDAIEGVGEVMSVTRVPRVNRGPAGSYIPVPLLAKAPRDDADAERVAAWKASLLADPQVVPTYLSRDGRYGTILLSVDVDSNDLTLVKPVVRAVERVLHDAAPADISFFVGGVPAIRADVLDVVVRDQMVAVPISGVLMGLLLILLFRSKHGVLIPVIAAGVPNLMLLGVMGYTGETFGLLNQVYLALVPAIAVADAVHLVARYHEETRRLSSQGLPGSDARRDQAIVQTMTFMGVACFLTSFTTVVGFMSLLSTDMPVLRSFGVYAAVGVALAFFTVLVIVPLALTWTRSEARRLPEGKAGLLGAILDRCVTLTTDHAKAVVFGGMLLTAASIAAGMMVVTDWKVTKSFNDDHPVSVANAIVDQHLGGVLSLEFDLSGPEGTFARPEVLEALAGMEREASEVPGVRTTVSPATLLRVTSTLVGGPDAIPSEGKVVERLFDIANKAGIVSAFVSTSRDRARMMVRMEDIGAVGFLATGAELEEQVARHLGPLGVQAHLTGSTFVSSRGISRVTTDLRNSLISAFGIIGLIIAILFRSVRFGVLSLVPNMLPLMVGYGAMGLLGWELEPARAVVFTIAIGVSVDSAIHVLARFNEERDHGLSVRDAVSSAVMHSGRAITITSIMLMVGFAANINSQSPANAAFGRLGAIIISAALLSNLIILPALLMLGFGGKPRQAADPVRRLEAVEGAVGDNEEF